MDKETAKEELRRLVQKYRDQKGEIANEEQVCQSLILPLFQKVLGWDTENPSEFKSQYSQMGKRSDYVILLNGISQFLVEVKSLQHEVRQDYNDYQQTLTYLKNKEKDFAILTNFKHLIILRNLDLAPLQCEVKVLDIEKVAENDADFGILWNFQKEFWTVERGGGLQGLKSGKTGLPVSKLLVEDMKRW